MLVSDSIIIVVSLTLTYSIKQFTCYILKQGTVGLAMIIEKIC